MNFRVRMGKMEKQCNFFSGFLDVEILIAIFFQFRICVFLSRGDCVFFLDRVTPGIEWLNNYVNGETASFCNVKNDKLTSNPL